MRRNALFTSVAVLPLILLAPAVHAQAAPKKPQQKTTKAKPGVADKVGADASKAEVQGQVTTQQAASPGAPTTVDAGQNGADIIVRGLRQSLASSQAIKRDSDSIIDAIVADDIGKLPDYTAAETIARIAGVQVTRSGDEANGVLIRGLPDVATSYNGREIFTAESRRVALQDFPAQAIAGIEVYKSGTADIIEPGLAGLVNVRTRRPFDFKGLVVAGGLRGTYNDQSRKYDGNGNILLSDRWKLGDGEIGFLANVTYAQQQYYNGVRYNGTYIRDDRYSDYLTQGSHICRDASACSTQGLFYFPNNVGLYNDGGKRSRPSGNFALQWAPNSDVELFVEGIYQGYRGRGYADNFDVPVEQWGPDNTAPVFTNVVLAPGQSYADTKLLSPGNPDPLTIPQAVSLTKTSGSDPQGYRSTQQDQTDTYQIAFGGKWHTDRATLSADFAYTTSRYDKYNYNLDFRTVGARTVDIDFNKAGGVAFNFPNWDPFNPNNYLFRGFYEAIYKVKGSGWQGRVDLALDTDIDFLPKLQFGFRGTTRHAEQTINGSRYADLSAAKIPYASLPIGDLVRTTDPFRGGEKGFTSYLTVPRNGIYDNRVKLEQFTLTTLQQLAATYPNDQYFKDRIKDYSTSEIQVPATSGYQGDENTYSAYAQGKYRFDVGPIGVDGVVGVRAVITDGTTFGVSSVCLLNDHGTPLDTRDDTCDTSLTPRREKQDYVDILPNASMRIRFTPKLQLRLGYTRTRTKPDFSALNPALTITPVIYAACLAPTNPNYNPSDTLSCRTPGRVYPNYSGSQGNPQLQPFTSKNYDVSLEWYFSRTGFVSAAVFQRDINGFTTNVTRFRNDPAYGVLQLSSPINAADSQIKGAEVNFQTFLDFLPGKLDGFGVSANVSYLTGKSRYPNGYDAQTDTFAGAGVYQKIPGLSTWTYNAALFYEKDGLNTRISYNRRSQWINGYNTSPDNTF